MKSVLKWKKIVALAMAWVLVLCLVPASFAAADAYGADVYWFGDETDTIIVDEYDIPLAGADGGGGAWIWETPQAGGSAQKSRLRMSVNASAAAPVAGGQYSLVAGFKGVSQAPTGTVTFYDNGALIGSVPASSSGASVGWTPGAGDHYITAQYTSGANDPYADASAACTVLVAASEQQRDRTTPPRSAGKTETIEPTEYVEPNLYVEPTESSPNAGRDSKTQRQAPLTEETSAENQQEGEEESKSILAKLIDALIAPTEKQAEVATEAPTEKQAEAATEAPTENQTEAATEPQSESAESPTNDPVEPSVESAPGVVAPQTLAAMSPGIMAESESETESESTGSPASESESPSTGSPASESESPSTGSPVSESESPSTGSPASESESPTAAPTESESESESGTQPGSVNLSACTIQFIQDLTANPLVYDNTAKKPAITVTHGTGAGQVTLVEGVDYTATYTNNVNAGTTATVTITPASGSAYTGSGVKTFEIKPRNIAECLYEPYPLPMQNYTGNVIVPSITLKDIALGVVVNPSNYTITPAAGYQNINPPEGRIVITGQNNYTGTLGPIAFAIGTVRANLSFSIQSNNGSLTLYAEVTQTGGVPAPGSVRFTIATPYGNYIKDVTINSNGVAVYVIDSAMLGNYTVSAQYFGLDGKPGSEVKTQSFSMPRVDLTAKQSSDGMTVDLTAIVRGFGNAWTNGYVTFKANGQTIVRVPVRFSGVATCTYTMPWGHNKIDFTAVFEANGFITTTSNVVTLRGYGDRWMPDVSVTAKTSGNGKNATLTATVTSQWGRWPAGTVSFYNGNKLLGNVALQDGKAVFTWTNVKAGTYTIYAVYQGDGMYRAASAMATYKKTTSGGSGSGSSGSQTPVVNVPSTMTDPLSVLLRDDNNNTLTTYNVGTMTMHDGVLRLETTREMEFYSYGFNISLLNELDASADGYFEIVAPQFTCNMPYELPTKMQGYTEFIARNGLSASQVELRLNVRQISDPALESAFRSANPNADMSSRFYRVELALYDTTGRKLDYSPGVIETPVQLIIPTTRQAGKAQRYDESLGSFLDAKLDFADNNAILTVDQNGIYVIATEGF